MRAQGDRGAPAQMRVARILARSGFIAADEEAAELVAAASENGAGLGAMLRRRLSGEPLAWITGRTLFCDTEIRVDRGVFVPRWHTELIAERAVARLPTRGVAVDLCTGSGAVAVVMQRAKPGARVVATDIDERAVTCATRNGVEALVGDGLESLPAELRGCVDVIVAVVPYVPTNELPLLQRDTFRHESPLAYDGGPDGTRMLLRVVRQSPSWLSPGAALILELGGDQHRRLAPALEDAGFAEVSVIRDADGDVRGVEATSQRG